MTLQSLLLWTKQLKVHKKSKGFSLCGTPKILGVERKNAQESQENRKTKKQGNRKKQGLEGQSSVPLGRGGFSVLQHSLTHRERERERDGSVRFRILQKGSVPDEPPCQTYTLVMLGRDCVRAVFINNFRPP